MSREIKFRGKRVDTGEWVYGGISHHIKDKGRVFITIMNSDRISDIGWHQEVIPDSVGQYTGLKDKNGVDVYEGDVLEVETRWKKAHSKIEVDSELSEELKEIGLDAPYKGKTTWTVEHKIYTCDMGYFAFGIDRRFKTRLTKSKIYNTNAVVIGNIHDKEE